MDRIASFQINHDTLTQGIYLSRQDGDIDTFDLRLVRPNTPPFMTTAGMHAIEHIVATVLRNGEYKDGIIYFGPMGCRTGFYLLTRGIPFDTVIAEVTRAFACVRDWQLPIPGASREECGNYLDHDLDEAKAYAADYLERIHGWTAAELVYPK